MTYFDLFEIPLSLKIDTAALHKKYVELSRRFHPDFFTQATQSEQAEALEKSAMLNKGLKTLQNPDETLKYVLQLKGIMQEEEKYELPPDFLMEVLDINEALMDDPSDPGLLARIDALQKEIYEPVKELISGYNDEKATAAQLQLVKDYYYKKKYLSRIRAAR